jgi:serine/threonine protein kinase
MAPKRDAPADTRPDEEGSGGDVFGGPDSNGDESDPAYDVDPGRRGPLTGRLIDGRYQILDLIGEGGMGAVYRAVHKRMDKELAFKVLLPEYTAMEGLTKRFQQEAQSASRLDHPGIIQVFDFGQTDDGLLYLVMAYLRGRSLTDIISAAAPMPAARAVALGAQICDALGHAHAQGVVHRDLKPDNVMILPRDDGAEQVKLLDFGIAKITQGKGAATGLTELGAVFGTPEYLSPEQAAGDPADHRSDLYSVAVLMYEMLSARNLFCVDTNVKYLSAHIHDAPTPLGSIVPSLGLSSRLDQVVMQGLAKSPDQRFQSAEDLALALRRAVSQPEIPVAPDDDEGDSNVSPSLSPSPPPSPGLAALSEKNASLSLPLAQPTADLEAERKRKLVVWGLASAVGALVVLVAALSLVLSDDSRSDAGKKADGDRARALASDARLRIIEGHISGSRFKQAEKGLNEWVGQAPKDPRVHLLYGHLYCHRGVADACLASYTTALVLDREVRLDEQLLANLHRLMTQLKGPRWGRPARVRAVGFACRVFARGPLGKPVVEMFTRYVNKWWEHDLVWRIVEFLKQHEAAGGIDWSHAYEIRFRSADDCDLRKKYIQEIVVRADAKLLPLLGKLYAEKTLKKPYSRRRISNHCLQQEAAAAIKALGGVIPRKKRPRSRGSKKHRRGR